MSYPLSWALIPIEGFDACPLGRGRDWVRNSLGVPESVFRRAPDGPLVEDYQELGVQVSYDASDRTSLVEVALPATPTMQGVMLLGRLAADVYSELRAIGIDVVEDDAGALVPGWGAGLFVAAGRVEAVSVGR